MNNKNPQSLAMRARDRAKSLRTRLAAVTTAVTASLFSVAAWAQATDVGAAITSEVTNAKDKVSGILVILAAIVGVLLLWAYVKKAR
jgi:hypothetical protein